ncbi:DUF1640 domain-containing protein [Erwinia tracheiphila]|uniref:DUF1640 domain-containing protein n=1 Tax=Erwinia tracheiphila TaxID=65700 RepID=A0A0M2KBR0_9GAMM|nr:hypothetical protein [Erwinia tracheiphila]EOS96822.1 hypothetical protein ETR_00745 [Erwinia tracheiphila PSU-1]KKF34722.1 hypothetical protein SY86_03635 [Erwinia tracheiphila]UIA86410.1 DUF1640 domain-containing protein [Erwinia tracheiphila]
MAQVAFDTLEAVDVATRRDLDDAKKELSSEVTVVKRDLEDVRKELKSDIALVRTEITDVRKDLEAKIDKLSLQLTVRLGGMLVAAIGVLAALIKLPF